MRFPDRLAVTLSLIRHALLPPRPTPEAVTAGTFPLRDGALVIPPAFLPSLLRDSTRFFPDGAIAFFVAGASAAAAPFLLARLKRWGFSGGVVTVEEEGLRVVARR